MFYNQDYFASHSMNQTVSLVRDKLDKVMSPAAEYVLESFIVRFEIISSFHLDSIKW